MQPEVHPFTDETDGLVPNPSVILDDPMLDGAEPRDPYDAVDPVETLGSDAPLNRTDGLVPNPSAILDDPMLDVVEPVDPWDEVNPVESSDLVEAAAYQSRAGTERPWLRGHLRPDHHFKLAPTRYSAGPNTTRTAFCMLPSTMASVRQISIPQSPVAWIPSRWSRSTRRSSLSASRSSISKAMMRSRRRRLLIPWTRATSSTSSWIQRPCGTSASRQTAFLASHPSLGTMRFKWLVQSGMSRERFPGGTSPLVRAR